MGTFNFTHIVEYLGNGDGANDPLSSIVNGTLTDGDSDTTFENGDTVTGPIVTQGATLSGGTYLGTTVIDGQEWPVFYFDNVPPNSFGVTEVTVVYMNQAPSLPLPATLDVNENDIFDRACFLPGTRIATPDGERAVENLAAGDLILTAEGRSEPVRFVGRQRVLTAFGPAERLMPVRIAAGALGDGLPLRDLVLTADHALLIDGLLVNAGALVNGESIDWVPLRDFGESYTVYHVETEAHDVLLAEGAPAETFIDYQHRRCFENYAEYLDLYGEDRTITEMPFPRISAARLVPQALRERLASPRAA